MKKEGKRLKEMACKSEHCSFLFFFCCCCCSGDALKITKQQQQNKTIDERFWALWLSCSKTPFHKHLSTFHDACTRSPFTRTFLLTLPLSMKATEIRRKDPQFGVCIFSFSFVFASSSSLSAHLLHLMTWSALFLNFNGKKKKKRRRKPILFIFLSFLTHAHADTNEEKKKEGNSRKRLYCWSAPPTTWRGKKKAQRVSGDFHLQKKKNKEGGSIQTHEKE